MSSLATNRYDYVVTKFGDEDSSVNVASSLFEVKTVAGIGVENDPDASVPTPGFQTAIGSNTLAVALGGDTTVFGLSPDVFLKNTVSVALDAGDVRAVHFVGGTSLLAAVSNGVLRFYYLDLSSNSLIDLELGDKSANYLISSKIVFTKCRIVLVSDKGSVYSVTIPHFTEFASADQENVMTVAQKCLSGIELEHANVGFAPSAVHLMSSGEAIVLPSDPKYPICLLSTDATHVSPLICLDKIVLVRECAGGDCLCLVNEKGTSFIFDLLTLDIIDSSALSTEDEVISDLHFLDDTRGSLEADKVVIIIERKQKTLLEVRSRRSGNVSFSLEVRSGTQLHPAVEGEDRVLFFIEPMSQEDGVKANNLAYVRELCEAQPDACLERMLRKGLFSEAETFATKFKLDLQKVHLAHMEHYRGEVMGTVADEELKKFLSICDMVTDDNQVGDACVVAVTLNDVPKHIQEILEYTTKRKITDEDTLNALNHLKYTLGTLRIVLGDKCDPDVGSQMWVQLGREDSASIVFGALIAKAHIKESRMVWERHNSQILNHFHVSHEMTAEGIQNEVDFLSELFEQLIHAIRMDVSVWKDCVSLVETDMIAQLGAQTQKHAVEYLCEFAVRVVGLLEQLDAANFPDNALYVAQAPQRLMDSLIRDAFTPLKQAEVSFITVNLISDTSEDGVNALDKVNDYVRNLKDIKELKDKYNCPLSYQEFVDKSISAICYDIIDKALSVPMKVKQNVDEYARPYMKKHNLPVDETLYEYVKRQACLMAGSTDASNMFDVQCLIIIDAIESRNIRNSAVLELARRASVPWKEPLKIAVEKMLRDKRSDKKMITELREVCVLAEIALILRQYGLPTTLEWMNTYYTNHAYFCQRVVNYMFHVGSEETQSQSQNALSFPPPEQRLKDVEQVAALYKQLYPAKLAIDENGIRVLYFQSLLRIHKEDGLNKVLDFVAECEEKGEREVCDTMIRSLISMLDMPVFLRTTVTKQIQENLRERHLWLTTISSLITRFRTSDPTMLETQQLIKALITLQERFDFVETTSFMRSREKRLERMQQFVEKNDGINELLEFARVLRFTTDETMCIILQMNEKIRNAELALSLISCASSPILPVFTATLAKCCLSAAEMILLQIHELSASHNTDDLDRMFYLGSVLYRKMPDLVMKCAHDLQLQQTALRISGYLILLMDIFGQGSVEDEAAAGAQSSQEIAANKAEKQQDNILIISQSHRLGLHRVQSDGPLFEKVDTARLVGRVARSVRELPDEIDPRIVEELQADWDELFMHLNLHSQYTLELNARTYASRLECMTSRRENLTQELISCVRSLCEKVIASHPCDLWTASAALLSLSPSDLELLMVSDLRTFAMSRKNPQTQLNYTRIAQFLCVLAGNNGLKDNLTEEFKKALWQKRMLKNGVTPSVCKMGGARLNNALEQFANAGLDPHIVTSFCNDFGGSSSLLLNYAVLLLMRASAETDDNKCVEEYIQKASLSVELSGISREGASLALKNLLYALCPYKYEIHSAIASILRDLKFDPEFVDSLISLIKFLRANPRKELISKEEYVWYRTREQKITNFKKSYGSQDLGTQMADLYGSGSMAHQMSEMETNMDEMLAEVDNMPLYERDNALLDTMPAFARTRLPLHPLLHEGKDDLLMYAKPIIDAELNIYNVRQWQDVMCAVRHLHVSGAVSRVQLLSSAVFKKAKEAEKAARVHLALIDHRFVNVSSNMLDDVDAGLIESLMCVCTKRVGVITTLSTCFKKMTSCELKLRFLRLGLSVAETWTNNKETYNITDEDELAQISSHITRLQMAIVRLETERLLKEHRIFDEKTSTLIGNPEELIEHIYEHRIEWSDVRDIAAKGELIKAIAAVTGTSEKQVEHTLVVRWLDEDMASKVLVDLNDTMGGGESNVIHVAEQNNDQTFTLPIFEASVSRVVHLVKRNVTKFVPILVQILGKKGELTADLCRKKIVALCVILRSLNSTQLMEMFQREAGDLCSQIETWAYMRLLALANIDMSMSQFVKIERAALVRQLVSPNTRQTPQVAIVATALTIDYESVDRVVIDSLLNKLHAAKQKHFLALLLKYCRNKSAELGTMRNLPLLWARAFDWNLADGDVRTELGQQHVSRWLHFLFSCPSVGGRSLESLRPVLQAQNCHTAVYLLSVLASFTQKLPPLRSLPKSSPADLSFAWTKELCAPNANQEEEDGEMDTTL